MSVPSTNSPALRFAPVLGIGLLSACAATAPSVPAPGPVAAISTVTSAAPAPLPTGARTVVSNGAAWRIVYRTSPDPPPRGEPFAVEAWVYAADDPSRARTDVQISIDAAMPEHQHGMNRVPIIEPSTDGGFVARGLLFHMPGRWELYFDVTRNAITERAQVEIQLE